MMIYRKGFGGFNAFLPALWRAPGRVRSSWPRPAPCWAFWWRASHLRLRGRSSFTPLRTSSSEASCPSGLIFRTELELPAVLGGVHHDQVGLRHDEPSTSTELSVAYYWSLGATAAHTLGSRETAPHRRNTREHRAAAWSGPPYPDPESAPAPARELVLPRRNMTAKWADAAIQVIAFDEAAEADRVTGGLRFR